MVQSTRVSEPVGTKYFAHSLVKTQGLIVLDVSDGKDNYEKK